MAVPIWGDRPIRAISGGYRVVPSVPMRTRPKLLVEFFDPSLEACQLETEERRENVDIPFRVRRKGTVTLLGRSSKIA